MPVSAGRGPLSKAIRNLCEDLDQGAITKEQFQAKLRSLISLYNHLNVGLALDYWIRVRRKDRVAEYWQLADQTDTKIRKALKDWQCAMSK